MFPTLDGRNPGSQLILVVDPIIYKVFYIPGGDRRISEPSTVANLQNFSKSIKPAQLLETTNPSTSPPCKKLHIRLEEWYPRSCAIESSGSLSTFSEIARKGFSLNVGPMKTPGIFGF